MPKVVYNGCYGGFGISQATIRRYCEIKGIPLYVEPLSPHASTYYIVPTEGREGQEHDEITLDPYRIPRHDPALVQAVEELGADANGECAKLKIDDSNSGLAYRIRDRDGYESVDWISDEWIVAV